MGTTQAVVARLESGKTMPSTRTLERFAKATQHHNSLAFCWTVVHLERTQIDPSSSATG